MCHPERSAAESKDPYAICYELPLKVTNQQAAAGCPILAVVARVG